MKHVFIVGFDFGTSYSKVVVRDQLTGVAKAATFGAERRGLLPSFVRFEAERLSSPLEEGGGRMISYLKLIAADAAGGGNDFSSVYSDAFDAFCREQNFKDPSGAAGVLLAFYFFSVIRGVRAFNAQDPDWSDSEEDPMMVQLAVPTGLVAGHEDPVEKLLRDSLRVAHFLAHQTGGPPTTGQVREAFTRITELDDAAIDLLDKCCVVYPEVAAGVQTVLRSRGVPEGKYITMDVGAGTVDLNVFYRRRGSLDYWSCRVEPLGFAKLDIKVGSRVQPDHETTVAPLPGYVVMSELQKVVQGLMLSAFRFQPKQIAGNGSGPWSRDTHAYIWGGGSSYSGYETSFLEALRQSGVVVPLANRLPKPSDDFTLPGDIDDFGRMAVAFGLSFHHANLDSVALPSELKTYDERYPDYWRVSSRTEGTCTCQGKNPECARCGGRGFLKVEEKLVPQWSAIQGAIESAGTERRAEYRGRYHSALVGCMDHIHRGKPLIVERVVDMNRIRILTKRPELGRSPGLIQDANLLLLQNPATLGGNVFVVPGSAIRSNGGVRVVVSLRDRTHVDVELRGEEPDRILRIVNSGTQAQFLAFGCGVCKDERGEFHLIVNKLPATTVAHP